ncbi:hypothetical protein [Pleurocapsa sp. PCC 7327]|uniref:hypothetical protein n=1 Tax=Pleurocapsa sp. PCC 7327 TaxID=118163 RepID=UPI0002D2F82C|nr:hypothetical protein [Pleurocapsa sp. PCC 7327]
MKIADKTWMQRSQPSFDFQPIKFDWRDLAIAIVLILCAGLASYQGSLLTQSVEQRDNIWFAGDSALVFTQVSSPENDVYRRVRHPWFPILAPALVYLLKITSGVDSYRAWSLVTAGVASLWIGMLFVLLRLIGCR